MNAIEVLKAELEMGRQWLMALISDVAGAEVTSPTPRGGNHPLWVLGHVTHSEAGMVNGFVLGQSNPLAKWDQLFDMGSQPVGDLNAYPSLAELRVEFEKVRANTLKVLAGMSESDLDKPSYAPAHIASMFGTVGQCFAAVGLHCTFHAGQAADARRAAGKKPIFG